MFYFTHNHGLTQKPKFLTKNITQIGCIPDTTTTTTTTTLSFCLTGLPFTFLKLTVK